MPLYEWVCEKDGLMQEDIRKVGDFTPPLCQVCNQPMQKIITPVSFILKGQGWSFGTQEKLKRRSENQGKDFFEGHPDKQDMVSEKIQEQRKLE
jgi:putative FmdB family regulatory protein